MTEVTYTPLENGDPIETEFGGIEFRAHKPVDVPLTATILTMVRQETLNAEGLPRATAVEKRVPVVEILKGNPYFTVAGEQAAKRKPGRPAVPKTPMEYRSHAQAWFATAESHDELAHKWDSEAALREKIGVHDDGDDVKYLRPFFDARYHDLKKAAA